MIPKQFNGFTPKIVNNRNCNNCTLCCVLPQINEHQEINKKSFKPCKYCDVGIGCRIYEKRPMLPCGLFKCLYLDDTSENQINLKPKEVGFFIYEETQEALDNKVLTIYCQQNRLKDLIKNLNSDPKIKKLLDDNWCFQVRYNDNDNHIKKYDPKAFGERLVFYHRKWGEQEAKQKLMKIIMQHQLETQYDNR